MNYSDLAGVPAVGPTQDLYLEFPPDHLALAASVHTESGRVRPHVHYCLEQGIRRQEMTAQTKRCPWRWDALEGMMGEHGSCGPACHSLDQASAGCATCSL